MVVVPHPVLEGKTPIISTETGKNVKFTFNFEAIRPKSPCFLRFRKGTDFHLHHNCTKKLAWIDGLHSSTGGIISIEPLLLGFFLWNGHVILKVSNAMVPQSKMEILTCESLRKMF
jgi:hypothetical protein